MAKIEQKVGDLRGGKGYGQVSFDQFTHLLRHAGHLTDQQRVVKVSLDKDGIHYLTKTADK